MSFDDLIFTELIRSLLTLLCKILRRVHDFLSVCEYRCLAVYVLHETRILRISQIYYFSPVYMRLCRATFDWREYIFLQMSQVYGFSPVSARICLPRSKITSKTSAAFTINIWLITCVYSTSRLFIHTLPDILPLQISQV